MKKTIIDKYMYLFVLVWTLLWNMRTQSSMSS